MPGRLLDEVHLLASSYGWREDEILALVDVRRGRLSRTGDAMSGSGGDVQPAGKAGQRDARTTPACARTPALPCAAGAGDARGNA